LYRKCNYERFAFFAFFAGFFFAAAFFFFAAILLRYDYFLKLAESSTIPKNF